ncbi:MAG: hypothetical protein DRN25_00415 [Thermoplasmata archaeon]|nr:MAG: hypothetical protein DRN25_00415 [Thermoplasmata archaeon]
MEPLTHVEEIEDSIIIYVDLPFVRKEDISIYLRGRLLEISAVTKVSVEKFNFGVFHRREEMKKFRKVFSLPYEVEPHSAKAKYQNGILKITLKKKVKREEIKVR